MILQSLCEYYNRMIQDPNSNFAKYGFSKEKISYELVLDNKGNLITINDIGTYSGTKRIPKILNVPQGGKKTVNISPNFLWGDSGYLLGIDTKGNPERSIEKFNSFKRFVHQLCDDLNVAQIQSVLKFLDNWNPEDESNKRKVEVAQALDCNLVFRIEGETSYVHELNSAKEVWLKFLNQNTSNFKATCLIYGTEKSIARLHPSIKGVKNAQSSGASIVSFNLDSFCSYSKTQCFNAPVSEEAAFAYTTALNYLLGRIDRKIQIGDATTVFWADRPTPFEDWFSIMFNPQQEDSALVAKVRIFLENICAGKMPSEIDGNTKFFILGLSPNASRLSIRFWYEGTLKELSQKMGKHFNDIAIEKEYENELDYPGLWHLLIQTARQGKTENINPLLGGALTVAILRGTPYPESFLSALIGRIHAGEKVNYLRSAMIKGILVRNHRKEVKMSLDKNNKNPAYLLGRLFAVLEKAQEDALGNINATIRDRYYTSASTSPSTTFPILLRLNKHHTSKGEHGKFYEALNAEIVEELPAEKFPSHLSLEEQGLFAIGYYHQRNDFFKKRETNKG